MTHADGIEKLTSLGDQSFVAVTVYNENQPDSDFLERANIFWNDAVSNKCSKAKNMVRYPVLMDGISISDEEKLF